MPKLSAPHIPTRLMRARRGRPPTTMTAICKALRLSRPAAYGLIYPENYPVPAAIFDDRSDLAERVAAEAKTTPGAVRRYYLSTTLRKD